MPCAKNCCRGQGRTEATAKRVGGVSNLCPKMRTREKIPLTPIRCILFHPTSTFGVSMTPPGKGQGLLQGDSALFESATAVQGAWLFRLGINPAFL